MKHSKTNIAKGFFLLLLTVTILLSSASIYHVSASTKPVSAKEDKSKKETKQEEQTVVVPAQEAVTGSVLNLDFVKEIVFTSFNLVVSNHEEIKTLKRSVISEKYFRTLFTHIISPNAP